MEFDLGIKSEKEKSWSLYTKVTFFLWLRLNKLMIKSKMKFFLSQKMTVS